MEDSEEKKPGEQNPEDQKPKPLRGFAAMDPETRKAIARKGGESVPAKKRSFAANPQLASQAGKKGGHNIQPAKRSFSQNHSLAAEAGRKGGLAMRQPRKPKNKDDQPE